jgi:predicted nucleotidyltransferase
MAVSAAISSAWARALRMRARTSDLLDRVVAHFHPQRVFLFGSAARGEVGRGSDIDPLVVVDDDAPPEILGARSVYGARSRYHGAVDILPCRDLRAGGARSREGLLRRYRAARGRDGL